MDKELREKILCIRNAHHSDWSDHMLDAIINLILDELENALMYESNTTDLEVFKIIDNLRGENG